MFNEVFNPIFRLNKNLCLHSAYTFSFAFAIAVRQDGLCLLISDTTDWFFLIVDIRYNGWEKDRTKARRARKVARVENVMNALWGPLSWTRVTTQLLHQPPPMPHILSFVFHCLCDEFLYLLKIIWTRRSALSNSQNTCHGCSVLEKSCYMSNLWAWLYTNFFTSVCLRNISILVETILSKILTMFLETPAQRRCGLNAKDAILTLTPWDILFLLQLLSGTTPRAESLFQSWTRTWSASPLLQIGVQQTCQLMRSWQKSDTTEPTVVIRPKMYSFELSLDMVLYVKNKGLARHTISATIFSFIKRKCHCGVRCPGVTINFWDPKMEIFTLYLCNFYIPNLKCSGNTEDVFFFSIWILKQPKTLCRPPGRRITDTSWSQRISSWHFGSCFWSG